MLAVTAGLYAPVWSGPFVYEDALWMAWVDQGVAITHRIVPSRTLTNWTYQATAALAGMEPWAFHAGNLALHLGNGVLVYAIGAAVLGSVAGLIGAGMFLIHPLNSQAVSYIAARPDLLMTACVLLAVWASLAGRWWLAGPALVAAAMSKEIGLIVGLPLVVATLVAWRTVPERAWVTLICVGMVACGIGVWYAQAGTWWTSSSMGPGDGQWTTFASRQMTAIWTLLGLLVARDGFSIDHDLTPWDRAHVLSFLATWFTVAVVPILWPVSRALAWALVWVGIVLAPRVVMPSADLISEHHLYLAMTAISLSVGASAVVVWHWLGHPWEWPLLEKA